MRLSVLVGMYHIRTKLGNLTKHKIRYTDCGLHSVIGSNCEKLCFSSNAGKCWGEATSNSDATSLM